ncbi:hypothetical protein NitaMp009 (mitochondrion) [Nicotiana tabacum]|uniref:Uncharacterized protein n=1 Tax=Nicotiana tabacum TaxID=4097 RepID=Q5MA58_TOBAC|nr:hypothetical protein NitaMp009 [Nicotiana tabacum]UYX57572.1 hypothetical protein [Nicotiana tabacum]BAD83420.1 hypothetical protein [Nicotiana tabacum]
MSRSGCRHHTYSMCAVSERVVVDQPSALLSKLSNMMTYRLEASFLFKLSRNFIREEKFTEGSSIVCPVHEVLPLQGPVAILPLLKSSKGQDPRTVKSFLFIQLMISFFCAYLGFNNFWVYTKSTVERVH